MKAFRGMVSFRIGRWALYPERAPARCADAQSRERVSEWEVLGGRVFRAAADEAEAVVGGDDAQLVLADDFCAIQVQTLDGVCEAARGSVALDLVDLLSERGRPGDA